MKDTFVIHVDLRQLEDGGLSVGCRGLSPGQALIVHIQTPKRTGAAGFIGGLGGTRAFTADDARAYASDVEEGKMEAQA